MSPEERTAKDLAWGFWKAGWNACVARGGGWLKTYCGEPAWDLIAREEFEAFLLENQKLWVEANMAQGIKAFNKVYSEREVQPIPTPEEATHPGRFL
jgi:hypothetical protein